jgi:hypothetical protein
MEVDGKSGAARTRRNEVIADGGEWGDEPLQASRRSEALHGALPSSSRQMGIFRPVIEAFVRAMLDRRHDLASCRGVGPELVGDDALGSHALLLEQAPQQTSRRLGVAPGLHDFIENVAILIDSPPEPMPLADDGDDDLIEMPDVTGQGRGQQAGRRSMWSSGGWLKEFHGPRD